MISYLVTTIDSESLTYAPDDLSIRRWATNVPSVTEVRRGQTIVYRRTPDGPRLSRSETLANWIR
jgi:hypothetical protein